jgi:creatinine amidohydrolase/Fe(II)-dependent formamide hydrolase-like protein
VEAVSREFIMSHVLQIAMVEIWKIANSLAKNIPKLKENVFKHAGELMTSVMLYFHPDTVDMKKAKVEYVKSNKPYFTMKSTLGPFPSNTLPYVDRITFLSNFPTLVRGI